MVKGGDLTVNCSGLRRQRFQSLDELGVIVTEICSVAGKQPYLFSGF
jgi:hypothetical protein